MTDQQNQSQAIATRLTLLKHDIIRRIHKVNALWTLTTSQIYQFFKHYHFIHQTYYQHQLNPLTKAKIFINANHIFYGQFQGEIRQGIGVDFCKNGNICQGTWVNNQRQGQGSQINNSGNLYIGQFKQNKKHGKGLFYWFQHFQKGEPDHRLNPPKPTPQWYNGEWICGLPYGMGEHFRSNGDHYIGQFINGFKHGQGKQIFCNGDLYVGQFANGYPNGYGQYFWVDGSFFKGQFKQGQRSG